MQWAKQKHGFTIVELLIVVVVIAILAAITIVAYNGIQNRTKQSAAQTAVSQANKKVLAYAAQNSDTYPTSLTAAGMNDTTGLQYSYNNDVTPRTYGITATNGSFSYFISNTASSPTAGGYQGHGANGVAAIRNIITNPSFETNTNNWAYRWYGGGSGSGTNSRQTAGGFSGSAYLRKAWTAAGAASDNGFNSLGTAGSRFDVSAGTIYTLSAYMRTNRADVTARAGVTWYDAAGAVVGATANWFSASALTANTWTRISATTPAAPAGAVTASVYFSNNNTVSWVIGDTFDIDAAMMNEGSLSGYADGNTANWVWADTVNNSVSNGPAL